MNLETKAVDATHPSAAKTENSSIANSFDELAKKYAVLPKSKKGYSHPALNKALHYIYKNYANPIDMPTLASSACISQSHLSYLFKYYLGMSFKKVLMRFRVAKSMELFDNNPSLQVTQVCDQVGFPDLSFFVRKFHLYVGVSPSVYRDEHCRGEDKSAVYLDLKNALQHFGHLDV